MESDDIANTIQRFWHMEVQRGFNYHRRIYRDILFHFYLLSTDAKGNRRKMVDWREVQKRTQISEDEFNLCLGTFEALGIFEPPGVASPGAFLEIKRLVEESYAPDTPILQPVSHLTPRQFLNVMFSAFDAENVEAIRTVIAEVFRGALEVEVARAKDNELLITAPHAADPWGVWFQILPSASHLNDERILISPLTTMHNHKFQKNLDGIKIYYILVCPNAELELVRCVYEINDLWIMIGTSIILLLRVLPGLAQETPRTDLTNSFCHFFEFEQQEYTISVADGLERVKAHFSS